MSDANEIERLRAQVAELEAQLAASKPSPPRQVEAGRGSAWRAVSSAILITIACLLAPLSVASVWASNVLSDTDQYVETVAPLARDPAVQSAVADEVSSAVLESLDLKGITTDALEALSQQQNLPPRVAAALPALAVPLTNGVENFTRDQINNILASPQFAEVWDQVNRAAHEQVVKLLEGNQGGAVSAQDNTITLNLGPVIQQVKDRLVAQGFTLAARVPTVDRSFVLVQSDAVTKAQGFYRLLNLLGAWLPVIALVLLAAGVALARDRRRALFRGALGVASAMVVLGVGLTIARTLYVGSRPAGILTEEGAGNVFDTLVRFLRTGLRATAVLGLVAALAAFLAGPSTAAVRTRSGLQRGIGSLRGGAEAAGWQTGRIGTWTYAHKRALRISAVIAGGLVVMFWTRPTGWVIVTTALIVALVLGLIEFLGHPPTPAAAGPVDTYHRGSGADS
ncbi:MAG TPA: hypothetical protein VFT31_10915 [Kribbella sp.]|nr:hypothetical protein [Kribbella sp.]